MLNFITLFDKNYLSRAIALYESLVSHCNNFCLYILAMDNETENFLNKERKESIIIISLNQLEIFYPKLLEIKKERTRAEYCWTLTPYSIQYAINNYKLDSCIYIDADIYFYSNPKVIIDEAGDNSIIITEHRYTPKYDHTETSGKYCVQFMYFKNDNYANEALEWWRKRCEEWCYARCEDGKFGDQKYLDDWTTRFIGVYVPNNIGYGVAPWNMQQYEYNKINNKIIVIDKITKKQNELIFFHFHSLKKVFINKKLSWYLGSYYADSEIKRIIYNNYIKEIINIENFLDTNLISPITDNISKRRKPSFFIFYIKNIIKSIFFIKRMNSLYKKTILSPYEEYIYNME